MESLYLPDTILKNIHSVSTRTLRYRYGQIRADQGFREDFVVSAMVKVHGGIRFLRTRLQKTPNYARIRDLCLLYGEYGVRPYMLGQQKDGPSSACVFALLDDYCTHVGIETLDLIYRAYPFQEIRETWDRPCLERLREDAEWQGTHFPTEWSMDGLIGLMLSIHNQDRRCLVDELLAAVESGNHPAVALK